MKKVLMLIILFILLGIMDARAEDVFTEHSWDLGTEISYIKYEEPDVMEEKGAMYGIVGSYTSYGAFMSRYFMLKLEGKASWGQVDYENSGTLDSIDDYMLEFRGLFGRSCSVLDGTTIIPYLGFGYRYLNDDLTGTTSTGAVGYERESNYYYSPIGIEALTTLENDWSMGIVLEYDIFWKGIQKSHLSDVNSSFNDLENDQNKGYGIRGSIKFQKISEEVDFTIEPFIRYWNIEKSEEETVTFAGAIFGYGYEPKNNSMEIGGRFTVNF
ncbi:MAG: hypothetical protein NG712_06010 [Omnitrophica bacterium]|nr:hypothetical protein [Candidatus Omnitrophota bacterium]